MKTEEMAQHVARTGNNRCIENCGWKTQMERMTWET